MADQTPRDELLYFNGINGATGDYGLPPMKGEELSDFIQGTAQPENLDELRFRFHSSQEQEHFGVKEGVDPKKLDESGWGVIFAHDADPAIKETLSELLQLRRQQAGDYFKIYDGADGYRPGESKTDFLARHGAGPGPADPAKVPYYLLIVGSPEAIPYQFQYQLDVQYAVGRLSFAAPQEYANYAKSVVAVETGNVRLPRQVGFFGVANAGDKATSLSAEQLITPLATELSTQKPDWSINTVVGEHATKAQLSHLLGGVDTPALLFTASHGMEFPLGDPRQLPHQGALLCQDWPGPQTWKGQGAIPHDFYFAGEDVSADARLLGLLTFHFACYGAGTPLNDEFSKQAFKERQAIAPQPFIASLPRALLSHPKGGALAVIGHVERAWGYSFVWPGAGRQTTVFESTLARLLDDYPVGAAFEYFNERYAELSSDLSTELEELEYGKKISPYKLAGMWTSNNDARSYVILGDPAVRLPVAPADEPSHAATERPALDLHSIPSPADSNTSAAVEFGLPGGATTADSVSFSAYHPRAIAPGLWHKLLVYAHLAIVRNEVAVDAGQTLGKDAKDYRQAQAEASMPISPGTEITLVPQAEGLVFEPAQASLTWSDAWQRVDFSMQATNTRVGHVIEGAIACYVGPLLIADIRLPIVVTSDTEADMEALPSQEVQSAAMYQAVFASYSHADTAIVEAVEKAYQALGMDYLRDVMTLKSGQDWSQELLNMVERADVFQLFWSDSASQSAYVEQEWRHALSLLSKKGSAFIRPVYWDKTIASVPDALSSIHFAPVALTGLAEPTAPVAQAVSPAPAAQIVPSGLVSSSQLAALLPQADADLTSLTVSTYATADPSTPDEESLKVRTHISLQGDLKTVLPAALSAEDERYLEIHQAMVKEALQARLAYLKLIAQLVTGEETES